MERNAGGEGAILIATKGKVATFICQNCGECCGLIPVSGEELRRIREAINQMSREERERLKTQKRDKLTCPLRDIEKKGCAVYKARPQVCRMQGHVDRMPCPHNPNAPVMTKATELMYLNGIGEAVGVLGIDIGWKELEREAQQNAS
jgi:Fe-S-cluster containining protein